MQDGIGWRQKQLENADVESVQTQRGDDGWGMDGWPHYLRRDWELGGTIMYMDMDKLKPVQDWLVGDR